MKSQIASKNNKLSEGGFTLIEVLVTLGLIAIMFAVGSFANINFYTRELRASEENILISTLQKARSRAMNNVEAMPHGVYLGDENSYVLFVGEDYDSDESTNEKIPKNPNIDLGIDDFPENQIYFKQLSGEPSPSGTITMSDVNGREKQIVIEINGLINW